MLDLMARSRLNPAITYTGSVYNQKGNSCNICLLSNFAPVTAGHQRTNRIRNASGTADETTDTKVVVIARYKVDPSGKARKLL